MPESRSASRASGTPEIPSILRTIIADKALRLGECKSRVPQGELERLCRDLPPVRNFRAALDPGFAKPVIPSSDKRQGKNPAIPPAIIAEFKRRSPSRGVIRARFDLAEIHRSYARGGADAYSVLTEEDHFGGSLEDLKRLHELSEVSLLRKDFLFDPYQIYESRAAGADALLLIVAALEDGQLRELISLSRELAMEALVEVHSASELRRALECGAAVVGINNRDLHSFQVDIAVSLELASCLPGNVTAVSESGISGPQDIRRLQGAGIHAFLVGEQLMRAEDPGLELRRLKEGS
jgi:indole-3-glycerol phosphate synthase